MLVEKRNVVKVTFKLQKIELIEQQFGSFLERKL